MSDNLPVISAEGLDLTMDAETEAHARRGPAETEAHASLRIAFPPDAAEGRYELTYRPPSTPGGRPEVEFHAFSHSDRRLKRDIRPLVAG